MLKTTLPKYSSSIDESRNEIVTTKVYISVTIDTSIFAQQRWEANFPVQAATETLFAYIERIQTNEVLDIATAISQLKALYCLLEADEISTFKSFLQMFDLSNAKCFEELTDRIRYVFNLVLNSASASPKNL